jgi:hypothetical protein
LGQELQSLARHSAQASRTVSIADIESVGANKPQERTMRRFIIEREMQGIGDADQATLCTGSQKSNEVLAKLGPDIQWVESFVTANKIFCVYLATDEAIIRRHAEESGFPANRITEVKTKIDPTTARG